MIQHQPLKISIRQFTENPSGKGSAFLAKRAMIKQGLNATYVKLLNHYRRAFYAVPYVLDDGRYLYHVKVPSEMYTFSFSSLNKQETKNVEEFSGATIVIDSPLVP